MKHQDRVIDQFRKAIENFDEQKLARQGVHPKMIKAMKEGLESQYRDLLEERDNRNKKPRSPSPK